MFWKDFSEVDKVKAALFQFGCVPKSDQHSAAYSPAGGISTQRYCLLSNGLFQWFPHYNEVMSTCALSSLVAYISHLVQPNSMVFPP